MNTEEMVNKSETPKSLGHKRVQWAIAILVSLTTLSYGLQLGWVSPMTKVLQSSESPMGRPLTDAEISIIGGIPSLGALIAIPFLAYVVDTFGRRCAILIIAVLQLACCIVKLCSATFLSLLLARILCGLGAGGCFHVVPMYVREISQDTIRGTLGSMNSLFQNFGILVMYSLGGYLNYNTVLYLLVGLPFLTTLILLKAPESPSFLVKKGKSEEACKTIALLRGLNVNNKEVVSVIDALKKEDDYFNSIPNVKFFTIFKEKAWRRGFIILFLIFISHGLNGTFYIINCASSLLANSELNISPELQTLAIPLFLTAGTLVTLSSVDKLGRKLLLGTMFTISGIIFAGLASALLARNYGYVVPGWLTIAALLIIVTCCGIAISPVPFIVAAEMFNFQIRAKLMGCLVALAWSMTFVQVVLFVAITSYLGDYASYYIFGAINFMGAFITFTYLPETGGKSVEEIETELRIGKQLRKETNIAC